MSLRHRLRTQSNLIMAWLLILVNLKIGYGRIFKRCELGLILLEQNIPYERLGDWICLAHAASRYNSSMISGYGTNSYNNLAYGIYQISNYYYCYEEHKPKYNECGLNCTELADDDLVDDIRCAKLIYKRASDSFTAWQQFKVFCNDSIDGNLQFIGGCDFANGLKPQILNKETNVTLLLSDVSPGQQIIECIAEGTLPIEIKWLKNRKPLSEYDADFKVMMGVNEFENRTTSIISLRHVNFTRNEYVTLLNCEAQNKYGRLNEDFLVKVIEFPYNFTLPPDTRVLTKQAIEIGITIFITAITISTVGFCIYKRLLRERSGLTAKEVEAFYNGDGENIFLIGTLGTGYDNILAEPYKKEIEILKRDLQIDTKHLIGSGQFGLVYKGTYKNKEVAVKSVKPGADKMYVKALLSELKVLTYVKGHGNVLEIIGAYTKELSRGLVLLLLEFCPLGSLMKYLQVYRQQMESTEIVTKEAIQGCKESHPTVIDTQSMLGWSYQIANAMEYLSLKKVIHGDLATRNVLLLNHETIKIGDFGLSRKLYNSATYIKGEEDGEPLPWRWLAPETLRDLTLSSCSDVWSYGVTLWEIFSYGQVPYPGLDWSIDFLKQLEGGLRLKKPNAAINSVYNIMEDCWKLDSHQRPTFTLIRQNVYLEIKKLSKVDYIELDHLDLVQPAAYRCVDFIR